MNLNAEPPSYCALTFCICLPGNLLKDVIKKAVWQSSLRWMHNYRLQNKFVLQATVTGTFQMKKRGEIRPRQSAISLFFFCIRCYYAPLERRCVSRADRAGVAFRSSLLLYFAHWVPWIRLIQQSQLVYSHCGVMGTCELQRKEMWRWEAPSWRGRPLSFGALRAHIQPISARVMIIWKEEKGLAEKQTNKNKIPDVT